MLSPKKIDRRPSKGPLQFKAITNNAIGFTIHTHSLLPVLSEPL